SIICSPMTSLKTSIKTITYLSDIGCLEIHGASLGSKKERSYISVRPEHLFKKKNASNYSGVAKNIV
ncbi:hypothetical protein ACRWZ4_23420, partial [Escherichia coli]